MLNLFCPWELVQDQRSCAPLMKTSLCHPHHYLCPRQHAVYLGVGLLGSGQRRDGVRESLQQGHPKGPPPSTLVRACSAHSPRLPGPGPREPKGLGRWPSLGTPPNMQAEERGSCSLKVWVPLGRLPQKPGVGGGGNITGKHNTRQGHLLTRLPAMLPTAPLIPLPSQPPLASAWASLPTLSFRPPLGWGEQPYAETLPPSMGPNNNMRDGPGLSPHS